jgi:hypothetical protein
MSIRVEFTAVDGKALFDNSQECLEIVIRLRAKEKETQADLDDQAEERLA